MSHDTRRGRVPWNKGRLIGPKPPLKPKYVWGIRIHLQLEDAIRDLAMFDLAIDSKLRGCDLVRLKVGDVALNGSVRSRATVVQQKTGRPVQFEITEQTRGIGGRVDSAEERPQRRLPVSEPCAGGPPDFDASVRPLGRSLGR